MDRLPTFEFQGYIEDPKSTGFRNKKYQLDCMTYISDTSEESPDKEFRPASIEICTCDHEDVCRRSQRLNFAVHDPRKYLHVDYKSNIYALIFFQLV